MPKDSYQSRNMQALKKMPAGKMVHTPFGGAMMRSGIEMDEPSKRMQQQGKSAMGYGKSLLTKKPSSGATRRESLANEDLQRRRQGGKNTGLSAYMKNPWKHSKVK